MATSARAGEAQGRRSLLAPRRRSEAARAPAGPSRGDCGGRSPLQVRAGFTLLELLLAIAIFATTLVALGASVSQSIGSVAESINQRAAREACRAKLEAIVSGAEQSQGGLIEGREGFQWTSTREEKATGAADSPDEKYVVLTVVVKFPSDTAEPAPGEAKGTGTVKLTTLMLPPEILAKRKKP